MKFKDLVLKLPSNVEPAVIVAPQGLAFDVHPEVVGGFVPPDFEVASWPTDARVVVIAAPGAVGKSAAAAALANALKCPLVRAEHAQVGSYSLSGLVQDALGFSGTYIGRVSQGEACLVVDSLDEAHLKVGSDNFLAFLENVAALTSGVSADSPPTIVLFSRTDAAELVRTFLGVEEVSFADLRLEFFDLASSKAFISSYLDRRFDETLRPVYKVHLGWTGPFERMRERQFREIAAVVSRKENVDVAAIWPEVKDFLGYTPVLSALAEALAVANPTQETVDLASSQGSAQLLASICDAVLMREARKFRDQVLAPLRAHLPAEVDARFPDELMYAPEEQVVRLAGALLGADVRTDLPVSLPPEIRDRYEDHVRQFLPEHPFRRASEFSNVVFADYVKAQCVRNPSSNAIFSSLHFEEGAVGPYFAHFLSCDAHGSVNIPETLIGAVIRSWQADSERAVGSSGSTTVTVSAGACQIVCGRDFLAGVEATDELLFEISDNMGPLHLRGPIRNTAVISDSAVILGDTNRPLHLGPSVFVYADEIVMEASSLSVDYPVKGRPGVVLAATSELSANYLTSVQAPADSVLRIYTTAVPARLHRFQTRLPDVNGFVPFSDFVDLRAILLSFKPSAAGAPSVYWEKLDRQVIRDNAERRRIFEALLKEQVVVREQELYRVNLPALAELRFGLMDLKGGEPSREVLGFLSSIRLPRLDSS